MLPSLYSSITGMRNHQVSMDVIGNNIANVNTVGYKTARVTFKEAQAKLLQGASRPPGFQGGTNPVQIGMGMAVGSIDAMMTQGNLESTGKITDLAIEGNAYFVYGVGDARYYTRMGALQFDADGTIVNPANGFALQGKMANEDGTYEGQGISNLRVPFGDKAPARATTEVGYGCNLDSDSEGLGTVAYSQRFMAAAYGAAGADVETGDISLTSLFDSNGNDIGIRTGDILRITAEIGGTQYIRSMEVVADAASASAGGAYDSNNVSASAVYSYEDMVDEFNSLVSAAGTNSNTAAVAADGSILLTVPTAGGVSLSNIQFTSNRPGGSSGYVSRAFSFSDITAAAADVTANSDTMRRGAVATDAIEVLYDQNGNAIGHDGTSDIGLEEGATITINGAIGGQSLTSPNTLTYRSSAGAATPTTLQDLLDEIRAAFGLPLTDGTPQSRLSVSMNTADTDDDNIPDGAIVIRGQPETDFGLTNISLQSDDPDQATNTTTPLRFNANTGFTELQAARDTTVHTTSIIVYDESGDSHTMTTTFTRDSQPGRWLWDITMEGGETVTGGNSGVITFAQDGSPSSFTTNDQASYFSFDPMNGSNEVRVNLDVGSPGSFQGITQFRSPSTTAAKRQDGYTMGNLQQISINEYGSITGVFTNGTTKELAQIYVADFNNPGGLLKVGDSMYRPSPNSGEGVLGTPGVGSSSKVKPGALELSNVELATEFTRMITTQRGFQANARVITTSDQMLQELVQLIR